MSERTTDYQKGYEDGWKTGYEEGKNEMNLLQKPMMKIEKRYDSWNTTDEILKAERTDDG